MVVSSKYLRRYTDIPALIYLLSERKITLLDPQSWDDSNDSHYLALYREKKRLKSVLALCFSRSPETYHHWRVFANGSSGVCVHFLRSELLAAVRKQEGLRYRSVRYLTLTRIRNMEIESRDLPFLKRSAYEHEDEFRMIYESRTKEIPSLDVEIPLSCIDRITLSPWVAEPLAEPLRERLKSIDGCSRVKIVRSTLINNDEWKSFGEAAV